MRAVPEMLARLPNAQVLIVGGNDVSYGRRPNGAKTWREQMLGELGDRLDMSRVHFLGHLPYAQYLAVLQISAAHVYFTYPFVLSWSFLEAMAAGCHIIASRTPPIEEVVTDGENAELVDFFDREALVERVVAAVPARNEDIRAAARRTVLSRYDLSSVCLPNYVELLRRVIRRGAKGRALP
jgi:glycosyltransferase involved in cell wall biosynthesis